MAEILKRHGLWERFAKLDSFQLAKAVESGEVPPHVTEELKPYLVRENIVRLYSSKLRDWVG